MQSQPILRVTASPQRSSPPPTPPPPQSMAETQPIKTTTVRNKARRGHPPATKKTASSDMPLLSVQTPAELLLSMHRVLAQMGPFKSILDEVETKIKSLASTAAGVSIRDAPDNGASLVQVMKEHEQTVQSALDRMRNDLTREISSTVSAHSDNDDKATLNALSDISKQLMALENKVNKSRNEETQASLVQLSDQVTSLAQTVNLMQQHQDQQLSELKTTIDQLVSNPSAHSEQRSETTQTQRPMTHSQSTQTHVDRLSQDVTNAPLTAQAQPKKKASRAKKQPVRTAEIKPIERQVQSSDALTEADKKQSINAGKQATKRASTSARYIEQDSTKVQKTSTAGAGNAAKKQRRTLIDLETIDLNTFLSQPQHAQRTSSGQNDGNDGSSDDAELDPSWLLERVKMHRRQQQ